MTTAVYSDFHLFLDLLYQRRSRVMIIVKGIRAKKIIAAQQYTQRTPKFMATAPPTKALKNQPHDLILVAALSGPWMVSTNIGMKGVSKRVAKIVGSQFSALWRR